MSKESYFQVTVAETMGAEEILNVYMENYNKVRKLLDEDSKNDPANEPHLSKYKAKEILCAMKVNLLKHTASEKLFIGNRLEAMLGVVLLNIGIIDRATDELTSSDSVLSEAVTILAPYSSKPEIVITLIEVYNNLGLLWLKREEPEKAKTYLLKAKEAYETFKCSLLMPLSLEHILSNGETNAADFMILEKAYTVTLFHLAQVYSSLKETLKSAIYCHISLRRQLQHQDYEPVKWAMNSAALSEVFAKLNGFFQSRYHLAAASTILKQYGDTLEEGENKNEATLVRFKHRSADVAICWAKYCYRLMEASTKKVDDAEDMSNLSLEDNESICSGDMKSLVFPDLDVSGFESKVTDKFILTYQDMQEVFLCCQTWLDKAKEYYTLDTLTSSENTIEIIQLCALSYNYLAFYEDDDVRRAEILKKRIDMLEDLVKEVNPKHYLHCCRTLWFELGEVYSQFLNIKLQKENLTLHSMKEINMLCEKIIEKYELFLSSFKDSDGKMPVKLECDFIRPVATAHVLIAKHIKVLGKSEIIYFI
ncbi:KIF1-binding protein-like protein [Operophtera brumata]|uniref:KIF-binding protein n=1 Tax=Operophtera brumata TaxID=104452 RepID=A0A0L7KLG9_OPEBR|nr:KIF1-binding protein-like protein [Operophtera brumata]